jgi:hypothetical protein
VPEGLADAQVAGLVDGPAQVVAGQQRIPDVEALDGKAPGVCLGRLLPKLLQDLRHELLAEQRLLGAVEVCAHCKGGGAGGGLSQGPAGAGQVCRRVQARRRRRQKGAGPACGGRSPCPLGKVLSETGPDRLRQCRSHSNSPHSSKNLCSTCGQGRPRGAELQAGRRSALCIGSLTSGAAAGPSAPPSAPPARCGAWCGTR